jgi:hypothetical protein
LGGPDPEYAFWDVSNDRQRINKPGNTLFNMLTQFKDEFEAHSGYYLIA